MDYKTVVKRFNEKKVKDYTFAVLFFLIFSFFIYFAIRPNILTAIELNKELEELKLRNNDYERFIQQVVEHQSVLENNRQKLYVLDDAIPENTRKTYKLIDEFLSVASESGVVLSGLAIPDETLVSVNPETGLKTLNFVFSTEAPKQNISSLLLKLIEQRRLKDVKQLDIEVNNESSSGAKWQVSVDLDTYYYKL